MKRKAHPHEHQGELNIVPYLDIMVNLVMFMLMSMTGLISFNVLNVNMPDTDPSQAAAETPPPKPDEKNLTLNVSIGQKGFYIAATGGVLPGETATTEKLDPNVAPPTIPMKNGDYDYEALTKKMAQIKTAYPKTTSFFLAADKGIRYDVVVQTMDATRGSPTSPLFPDVAFAAL